MRKRSTLLFAVVAAGAVARGLSAQTDATASGGFRFTGGFGIGWGREYSGCSGCGYQRFAGAPNVALGAGFRSAWLIIGVEGQATFNEQRHFLAAFVTAAVSPT